MLEEDAAGALPVDPRNRGTLETFLALSTQWRWDGMSGTCLGLDYHGVQATLGLMQVRDKRRVFADLRKMERAALDVFNRR